MNLGKKLILAWMCLFALGFASCELFGPYLEGKVITTSDNILPGWENEVGPVPEEALPQDLRDEWKGKTIVLAPIEAVKPEAPKIELKPSEEGGGVGGFLDGVAQVGLEVAKGLFPGLAAWEGLLTVLSRRKRQHYVAAFKAALPSNGSVDLKDAAVSVAKAIGIAHSSPESRKVFEEELKKEASS